MKGNIPVYDEKELEKLQSRKLTLSPEEFKAALIAVQEIKKVFKGSEVDNNDET